MYRETAREIIDGRIEFVIVGRIKVPEIDGDRIFKLISSFETILATSSTPGKTSAQLFNPSACTTDQSAL